MLVDDVATPGPIQCGPGGDTLPFFASTGQALPDIDCVDQWLFSREVQPGKTVVTSYDFERPSVSLQAESALVRGHELADFEQFEHAGALYTQLSDGRRWAEDLVDETQSRHDRLSGATNAQGMAVGHTFALSRHARQDQNARFVCQGTRITASVTRYEAGDGSPDTGSYLRNGRHFAHPLDIRHPAECGGDTGAASVALLSLLAAWDLWQGRSLQPSALVCTSSATQPTRAAIRIQLPSGLPGALTA